MSHLDENQEDDPGAAANKAGSLAGVRLIVFDVDGTLVDSQHGIVSAMHSAFEVARLPLPEAAQVRRVVGLKLESAVARLLPEPDWALAQRVSDLYRDAFIAMRHSEDYEEPLFPGVHEVLSHLTDRGLTLGVATGKNRRGLSITLDRHGLSHYFTTLQSADAGPGKPAPDMLLDAMAEAAAAPQETLMIGDTTFDIEMARNASTHAFGVEWGYHGPQELIEAGAVHVLAHFDEVPRFLSQQPENMTGIGVPR